MGFIPTFVSDITRDCDLDREHQSCNRPTGASATAPKSGSSSRQRSLDATSEESLGENDAEPFQPARDVVAKLIADVYAGKLHPRVAAGLAPLLNLQLRTIEATDLERRLEKVEKLLARAQAEGELKGHGDTRA